MSKYDGSIAETKKKTIKDKFIKKLSLRVFAEEPTNPEGDSNPEDDDNGGNPLNYEDLIAKARKEEKAKHYKTIEKLKSQVATFTQQHNDDLLVVAGLKEKLAEAEDKLTKVGNGDSEEVTTLKGEIDKLKGQLSTLEKENNDLKSVTPVNREEVVAEVRAELEAEYEVKTYKVEKMAEFKEDILVPELVFGSTKEEVDASIQNAIERSKQIRESLGISGDKKKRGTPKTPANPSVSSVQDSNVSIEKLASMDVRSEEYAKLRSSLGLK